MPLCITLTFRGLKSYMHFLSSFYWYREVLNSVMNMRNSHTNPHIWFICIHAASVVHCSSRNQLSASHINQSSKMITMWSCDQWAHMFPFAWCTWCAGEICQAYLFESCSARACDRHVEDFPFAAWVLPSAELTASLIRRDQCFDLAALWDNMSYVVVSLALFRGLNITCIVNPFEIWWRVYWCNYFYACYNVYPMLEMVATQRCISVL